MPSRSTLRYASSAFLAAWLFTASPLVAQTLTIPGEPLAGGQAESIAAPSTATDAPVTSGGSSPYGAVLGPGVDMGPTSVFAAGSVYNPTLGAHIRARYNTQSYGQQEGQLDLGTMRFMELDGGVAFVDGQVTLNEESGVGYNVGLGYRWMTLPLLPFSPDDEKIMGVSVWSDGQTIGQENFFSQVGVSLEFLGDHIDFRANGYAPVGSRSKLRDGETTGDFTFSGNGLSEQLRFVRDTALTVGEAELAGRIGDLDAWVFGGVYGFNGGQYDGVGGEVGLRGYATPDLLLSVSVANDDEFDTNAIFSATWFIGRTRAENCPTGTLRDRFREPVMRNTYIASQQDSYLASGGALLDDQGAEIRVVHVDSTAAAGGDGSFENPLNSLDDINANSLDDDIVLAHGASDFNGQTAMLRDGQTFVGEGGGNSFQVTTNQFGTVDLPETAAGAQAGAVPTIDGGAAEGIVLADNNVVQNLEFDGGTNAIVTDATNGSFNPNLNNLTIGGTTGDGIALATVIRADVDDIDNDGNTVETIDVLGTVTIEDIAFNNVGGRDISIDGNATDADTESGETIAITNVTSTGNAGPVSIELANTSVAGGGAQITNFSYDGGATGNGGLLLTETAGTVGVTTSDFTGGDGPAITVDRNSGVVSVDSLTTIDEVTGNAVVVTANTANVTIDADVTTSTADGGTVVVEGNQALVSFGGDLTANNAGVASIINPEADVNIGGVNGDLAHNGTGDAISITDDGTSGDVNYGITINGELDNNGGRSVFIDGVDGFTNGGTDSRSVVQFVADIDDTGDGIEISNLGEFATVTFGPQVTIGSGANTAVLLNNNNDASIVDFIGLDITTTTGTGVFSNGGVLNVTGVGNTIATGTGRAIDITGASAGADPGDGLAFANITTTGADRAVSIDDYAGSVTIDQGTVTTTDSAIVLNDVTTASISDFTVTSSGSPAVDIDSTNTTTSTVTFNNLTTPSGIATAIDATQAAGAGDLSVTVNGSTLNGTTGTAMAFNDVNGVVTVTDTTMTGGAGAGVDINGGSGSFNFDENVDIDGKTGDAFSVNGGDGIVTYDGDITNTAGQSVVIQNKSGGSVTFGTTSVVTDTGDGIRLAGNTDTTIDFQGDTNVTSGAANGVEITNQETSPVTFADLDITTTTGTALLVDGGDAQINYTGAINTTAGNSVVVQNKDGGGVTFDSTSTVADTGLGIRLNSNTGGTYSFQGVMDVTTSGATNGVEIDGNDSSTFTFADLDITTASGTALSVDGGDSTVNYTGDIVTTAGNSVVVQNKDGGGVTFTGTSTVTDSGQGVRLTGNSAGTYNFNGSMDLDTTTNDAVAITGNTGGTYSLNDLDINTTTGRGFVATDGGTVGVSGTNTVTTTSGTGVTITDMAVTSATFDSVTVNGATNAILLQDNTGGTVTVNGGSSDTTGAAIVAENTAGLAVNDLTINTSGATTIDIDSTDATDMNVTLNNVDSPGAVTIDHTNTATGDLAVTYNNSTVIGAITANHSGAGTFDFNSTSLDVDSNIDINATDGGAFDFFATNLDINTGGAATDALNIALAGTLDDVDISLTGSSTSLNTGAASALSIDASGSAKQIRFELSSATLNNTSATDTFAFTNGGGSTLDATISGNVFTKTGFTANDLLLTNGASSSVNLALTGNNGTDASGLVFTNNNAPVNFKVRGVDGATVDADNNGDVLFTGGDANFDFDAGHTVNSPSN